MKTVRKRPVWQHAPDQVKAHFTKTLPLDPQPPEAIYKEFLENVLPYPIGNIHPRFWGWVFGTGTVLGAFSELLTASMNTNTGDFDHHSANPVEKQVIGWFKEMLGLGSDALHLVPVNDYFQIDLEALKATIAQDRKDGHLPFCVVDAAGTTNTGAVDDLNALADICQQENLWLHVDGAFGAWAALALRLWLPAFTWVSGA